MQGRYQPVYARKWGTLTAYGGEMDAKRQSTAIAKRDDFV